MIILLAMLCTTPLTLSDPKKDAATILTSCSTVVKAFTADQNQCNAVVKAYLGTTGPLSMPGYYVCQSDDEGNSSLSITPVKYNPKGTRT